jgi:hypothetical protein
MPNFHNYLMRHGEGWILKILEEIERTDGVPANDNSSLEDRWNKVMAAPVPQNYVAKRG